MPVKTDPRVIDPTVTETALRDQLRRLSRSQMAGLCTAGIPTRDGGTICIEGGCAPVGSWLKLEIINAICHALYPPGDMEVSQ
jgi:hypothetical protein